MFPESKRIWGDVEAEDSATAHCCLCFYLAPDQKGVEDVAASFCAPSRPRKLPPEVEKEIRCAADLTKYDPFYLSHIQQQIDDANKK